MRWTDAPSGRAAPAAAGGCRGGAGSCCAGNGGHHQPHGSAGDCLPASRVFGTCLSAACLRLRMQWSLCVRAWVHTCTRAIFWGACLAIFAQCLYTSLLTAPLLASSWRRLEQKRWRRCMRPTPAGWRRQSSRAQTPSLRWSAASTTASHRHVGCLLEPVAAGTQRCYASARAHPVG